MEKVLLDTVTTDSRGIAVFNVAGSERGKIQIKAEANNGALESPIFTLYDCFVKDIGVRGLNSEVWKDYTYERYGRTSINKKVVSSYTLLTTSDDYGGLYLDYSLPSACIIEFDCYVSCENVTDFPVTFRNENTIIKHLNLKQMDLKRFTWGHVKIEINGSSLTINDTRVISLTDEVDRFYFQPDNVNSIRFKNFCVYRNGGD